MTLRIPSKMLNQNLQVSTLTADSIAGITDLANFLSKTVSANGFQKLPGGMILQWGRTTLSSNTKTVLFNTAYPNACVFVGANLNQPTGASENGVVVTGTPSKTDFVIYCGGASAASAPVFWFSVGY